jgi:hypothetical protein
MNMKIKTSVGKTTTTLQWQYSQENVSIKFPGRVVAEYSEAKDLVIVVGDGVIFLLNNIGKKVSEFSYENSEACKFYTLAKSAVGDLGVTIVMAHTPEYNGERFWQHDIDVLNQKVSGPIKKWR